MSELLITIALLLSNGFFVASEFALIASRRTMIEPMAATSRRARTALRAMNEIPLMIAGAQLGITLCSLGLGAIGEPAVASILESPFHAVGIPTALRHGISFAIALIIVVALHTILGEMVPKNLAIANPEQLAIWLVPVHYGFCKLVGPVLRMFTVVSTAVLRLMKVTPKDELDTAYTPDELAMLIAQSREEGLLEDSEHRRLAQTLSSAERTVADVLVPLDRLTTLSSNPTVGEVESSVAQTGFSRFPVRGENGRLLGYLHVKDVLDLAGADPGTPVPRTRIRGLPDLPVDAHLDEALAALRRAQSHLARAVDADGALCGVVAMEDLVEEYVGTVRDGTHVSREL